MNNILQTTTVRGLTTSLTLGSVVLESFNLAEVLDLNFSNASITPLNPSSSIVFFVRQDRKDKNRTVKVFNELATLKIGLIDRSINFHNKSDFNHRSIFADWGINGRYRSFYLNDGCKYSWTSSSTKCLEKVINPNGGLEEKRFRVAKVKLMRQFKLDFEVLVDNKNIDPEIALATAFISMFTQWGVGSFTDTVGPTYIPDKTTKRLETINEEDLQK
ncbi:hypothetical protein FOB64_005619 [Candida albicans]|uniref:Uncharacterized protein n=1 Tax=Candida albicans TaxID=5476 RepID=A0A8H6BSK7_CANAX|nr:hypothetical protein FOB64_005619 [Candida albicans]